MPIFKNFYQVLGVDSFADADAVKSAYRKLARQCHPDLNAGNTQAEERFKDINEAYEILSDPAKRAMHDAALKAKGVKGDSKIQAPPPKAKASPPPATEKKAKPEPEMSAEKAKPTGAQAGGQDRKPKSAEMPINELFESFLKSGFSGKTKTETSSDDGIFGAKREPRDGKEKNRRGEDVVVKTAISPQEAIEGVVKTVNVQHNEICRRCSGTGKVNGMLCTGCNGEKINVRLKKIDVRIPAGVKNNSRVRVAKEGGRGTGGADNGDLFLQIEIAYDPSLRIEGLDVHGEMPVSLTDAVLGGEIDVMTLNGTVKMTLPPGTQTGRVFRLKERGVQSGLSKGDHFVTVTVVIPEGLSARERELYQELARLRPEKPKFRKSTG